MVLAATTTTPTASSQWLRMMVLSPMPRVFFERGHAALYSRSAAATPRNCSNSKALNGTIPWRCKSATSGKNEAVIGELLTPNACWFPRADVENDWGRRTKESAGIKGRTEI
jgi:hypothetical protein